ncbi:MAG: type II toxin-antitoxin system RelE/ParE family toxin [Bacteroidia bacterium]
MYQISFKRSAAKELKKLPQNVTDRIIEAIEELVENPRPQGYRKIVGSENLFRIRIGQYRVIYSIEDKELIIMIITVRHRKDAYR